MMNERDKSAEAIPARTAVVTVVDAVPAEHWPALQLWAQRLLALRERDVSRLQKMREALRLTRDSKVVWPAVKIAASKAKQIGWDDRSPKARIGLGAAAIGAAVFGGKSAGIAALGTAVGVPLWVVLGAGASFAAGIVEEISRRSKRSDDASYSVTIDAVRRDDGSKS